MNIIKTFVARLRGRSGLLLMDTACNALTTMLVVVVAARTLAPAELAAFSLIQLCLVMTITVVRVALWSPALATQRTNGRSQVPLSWLAITPVVAIVVAVALGLLVPLAADGLATSILLIWLVGCALLAQDGLRTVLMSRELTAGALGSDAVALGVVVIVVASGMVPQGALGIVGMWGLALGAALLVALAFYGIQGKKAIHLPDQSLAKTWVLGRWGALDATFSATAVLLPMFVATLVAGSSSAGAYRTLQTALGPMNILHTTVLTSFGLDAWQAMSAEGVRQLANKTRRLAWAMLGFSVAYVVVGLPLMALVSHVQDPDLMRIGLIVGVSAVLGALNTPFEAAALALGNQRFGAMVRFVVVSLSMSLSLPWMVEHVVPWRDPIGMTAFVTAFLTFAGWFYCYRAAIRREVHRAAQAVEPTAMVD